MYGPCPIQEPEKLSAQLTKWQICMQTLPIRQYKYATNTIQSQFSNSIEYFNGLGERFSTDLCHLIGVHPCTPAPIVGSSDQGCELIKKKIQEYVKLCDDPTYNKNVLVRQDPGRPFDWNPNSNRSQVTGIQMVYRKRSVLISVRQYEEYFVKGLLDPTHTTGEIEIESVQYMN